MTEQTNVPFETIKETLGKAKGSISLRESINVIRVQRDSHQFDESEYVDTVLRLIDQHTKSEVRQVLDRLEKQQRTYEVITRNTLPGYDSFTKKALIPVEDIVAERKLYE